MFSISRRQTPYRNECSSGCINELFTCLVACRWICMKWVFTFLSKWFWVEIHNQELFVLRILKPIFFWMHYIIYRIILEHGRIPVFVICFIEIKTGLFSFITTCNLIFQLQEIIPFDKNEDNVLLMYKETCSKSFNCRKCSCKCIISDA